MFDFDSLEVVQVEITNRCQASCPMCLRNIHGGIENPSLVIADWSMQDFKTIFELEVLQKIKTINFCGDFGDPIINADLIEMCDYAVQGNPNLEIIINTNGSARSKSWWAKLAITLPANHKVVFALDGLEDTHHLYRIGTDYSAIINNARSFILAGGNAEWMFIRFKHNEHQVEEARQKAKEVGFKNFNVKDSKRFGKQFPVLNRLGTVDYYLYPPSNSDIKPVEFVNLKDYKEWKADVNCFTLDTKELYIDAHGHAMPCCLIGSFVYANFDVDLYSRYGLVDETSIVGIASEAKDNVMNMIGDLGGLDMLDTKRKGIRGVMSNPVWQTLIHKKWAEHSSAPCNILCSDKSPYISIQDQINRAS